VNDYLKSGLGRWLPPMPELVKNDSFWLDPKDQHRSTYAREAMLSPTVPAYTVFNPGIAEVNAQQIWGTAVADVVRNGKSPEASAEYALKQIGDILAKYPIAQS
jgi:multiple sugar transport system substrate-binding protein